MLKILAAIVLSLALSVNAFAQSVYFIEKTKDEFEGTTIVKGQVIVKIGGPFDPVSIFVKISKNNTKYSLLINYENSNKQFLNAPKGETLFFLVNGEKKIALSGDGSEGHKYYNKFELFSNRKIQFSELATMSEEQKKDITNSIEELTYPIAIEDLQTLADAKELKFKIQGENPYVYTVDKDNIQDIQRFLKEYGEPVANASESAKTNSVTVTNASKSAKVK